MSNLERFVAQFQANRELGRGTLNLLMTAVSADRQLRYLGDNLYRANSASIGSLRRAAAIVYPVRWQAVLKPYEETIARGYDTPAVVQQLQEFENKLIADALSTITPNPGARTSSARPSSATNGGEGFIASILANLSPSPLSIALFRLSSARQGGLTVDLRIPRRRHASRHNADYAQAGPARPPAQNRSHAPPYCRE